MAHHIGDATTSLHWTEHCNDLIHRVCALYPENFVGVCQLPQSPGVPPANCIAELERCVNELGLHRLQPESGSVGRPLDGAAADRPVLVSVLREDGASSTCRRWCTSARPATRTSTRPARTTSTPTRRRSCSSSRRDLFKDFPTLRFIIPHGGGAVPYHWGRYRGLAQDMKRPPLADLIRNNVFFDTCVYHQPGIDLLLEDRAGGQHPVRVGDGRRRARHRSGDRAVLRRHEALRRRAPHLDAADRQKIFEGNARKVYPRINQRASGLER